MRSFAQYLSFDERGSRVRRRCTTGVTESHFAQGKHTDGRDGVPSRICGSKTDVWFILGPKISKGGYGQDPSIPALWAPPDRRFDRAGALRNMMAVWTRRDAVHASRNDDVGVHTKRNGPGGPLSGRLVSMERGGAMAVR